MKTVLIPPEIVEVDGPIIFLAGPIQGADMWQEKAIDIIHATNPDVIVANPRREKMSDFVYDQQVDWETHYLREAGKNGVVLFWLAKEATHNCDRSYAQTTRFELAEWKAKHERDRAKLVVGIEEGFTNTKYICRRFAQDCPDVPILSSLEETCKKAVELINEG